MSFFEGIEPSDTATLGGDFELIPNGQKVRAAIEDVKWALNYTGDDYDIKTRWHIFEPEEYANRKVFKTFQVRTLDLPKQKRDKNMLSAIDMNCGGKIRALGEEPNDEQLMEFLSERPMVLTIGLYKNKTDGEERNFIRAVAPVNEEINKVSPKASAPLAQPAAGRSTLPPPPPGKRAAFAEGDDGPVPF